jgi:hypothetical protein
VTRRKAARSHEWRPGWRCCCPPKTTGPANIIDVPRPIQGFAADVGMTPETFSRGVTQLAEAGILRRLSPPRLQVLDARRLRGIAAGRDDPGHAGPQSDAD